MRESGYLSETWYYVSSFGMNINQVTDRTHAHGADSADRASKEVHVAGNAMKMER